jgi:hypothetical protein
MIVGKIIEDLQQPRTHCRKGHELLPENIFVANSGTRYCDLCRQEWEYSKERKKSLGEPDTDAVIRARESRKRWRDKRPDYHKFNGLLKDYGLTREAYQTLLDSQDNKCPICLRDLPEVTHTDHDHKCCDRYRKTCGKCVRGVLCGTCNQGLGQFQDDEDRLRRAADYLKKYREIRELESMVK